MITSAPPAHGHPSRGRRTPRPSGDDRELAILTTLERLLEERALAEISVDDLAKGAGISRPTFYFYFPSKDAVLLTLADRVMQEADAIFDGLDEELSSASNPLAVCRDGINAFFQIFGAHRAVTLACAAARAANAELAAMWSAFMQKWVTHTAELIRAERERGAPETIAAEDLAVALNLMNERAMSAALAGDQPAVVDEKVVDTLAYVWFTSIYGTVPK
jgi:TetR/AcrR family transcriptional regulator, ethionamide resistance regulator